MSGSGVQIPHVHATGGEHDSRTPEDDVRTEVRPDWLSEEYEELLQTPVSELTAKDVSRLTELRALATEAGDNSYIQEIDDRLLAFVETLDLPTESVIDAELEVLEATRPSRRERIARKVAGVACGLGIGYVMGGPEGVLAGAIVGYVLVSQFSGREVYEYDQQ